MARVNLTSSLIQEYLSMYNSTEIRLDKLSVVENHAEQINANKSRYEEAGDPLGIPWFFIGLVHTLESNRNFNSHLHNGDPLHSRTTHVPAGRPVAGAPPFTWEESASDALRYQRLHDKCDWDLEHILYRLEAYNGWGYRLYHPHVKSPYLWSYCNHYTSGKYISDGTFSDTHVSRQAGAAVILKRMEQMGYVSLSAGTADEPFSFFYSLSVEPRVEDLQRFLNTFDGISLLVDGKPGDNTSAACKELFGQYLNGDPRII